MSVRTRLVRVGVAALIIVCWPGIAVLAQPIEKLDKDKKPDQEPAKKGEQTRVFTPKHVDPDDLLHAIEDLLDRTAALTAPRDGGPGGPPAPMGVLPPPVGPMGPGVGPMLPGVGPMGGGAGVGPMGVQPGFGALGGGMMGMIGGFGGGGGPSGHVSRLALDSRSGAIVIRGPVSEVQLASDLVKVLDTAAGKPLPEVKSLWVVTLKNAKASEIEQVLGNLEIGAAILALDEAKLLILSGPPAAMREAADVVKMLDVPAVNEQDQKKRKKLFGPDQAGGAAAAG